MGIVFEVAGLVYMLYPHHTSTEGDNDKKLLDEFTFMSHLIGLLLIFIGAGLARPALMNLSVEHLNMGNKSRLLAWQNVSGVVAGFVVTIIAPILRDKKVLAKEQLIHVNALMFSVIIVVAVVCHVFGSFNYYRASKGRELDGNEIKSSVKIFKSILLNQSRDIPHTNLLLFFIPLIIIWSLLEQNFTYFVLQALKSDRVVFSYKIQPVHVMALYPLFLIIFLIFNKCIFDRFLAKTNYSDPLKKVIIGCFFAIASYICAFWFEHELNRSGPVLPRSNEAHFRMYNAMKCDYLVETYIKDHQYFFLKHMEMHANFQTILDKESESFWYSIKLDKEGFEGDQDICPSFRGDFQLRKGKAMGYLIEYENPSEIKLLCYEDDLTRSKDLRPKVR